MTYRKSFEEGGATDNAPVFDPTKLAAAKPAATPVFDPTKLAATTPKPSKSIGDRLSNMWENASPGGPLWMAKEAIHGIQNAVEGSKAAVTPGIDEKERRQYTEDAYWGGLKAAQFMSPGAPKGTGGMFGAPTGGAAAARAKLTSPEAEANRELAREFDIPLTRGQATKDLEQIRYEDMAARGAYGKELQDTAAGRFDEQFGKIQSGTQQVGQTLSRGEQPLNSPVNAGASLNTEIADAAARAAATRDQVIERSNQAAAATRQRVQEQGQALDETIGQPGRPLAEPRQAGEAVNEGVRAAANQDRAHYQAKYEDVSRQPGQFEEGTFQGVGSRIRNSLHHHEDPVEITELTPAAHHAIEALDHWSGPNILNAADPTAGFKDPASVVTLQNINTFMKRLSGFYRSTAPGSEDQRAMRRIMSEFGNQVENAMADGMFSGDPAALGILRDAKAAFSTYQRTYKPRQAGDDVGTAMRRIVERNATPEETANMIIGSGKVGNAGLPVRITDRLQEVLGADSPEWRAIREAIWQKVSRDKNPAKATTDFVDSTLAQRMFTPAERTAMRTHAQGVRDLERAVEALPENAAATRATTIYQEAFSGDRLSGSQRAVFRRMVDGTATPEETAQVMFSAIGSGNPGDAARALSAIERIVGPNSPVMNTVRQGVWQKLTQEPFGKDQKGQQKMVQAINEFLNGKGGSVARQLYSDEERKLMARYAMAVKLTIIPKFARTNSDTAPALLAAVNRYGGMVASALGSIFHGGLSGGAEGYGAKKAIEYVAGKVGKMQESRKVNDSFDDVIPKPARQVPRVLKPVPRVLPAAVIGKANSDNPYAP